MVDESENALVSVRYLPLRRNQATATGLSFLDGDIIKSLDELPLHRIEIYKFRDAAISEAFTMGVSVSGQSNKVACTWEEGNTTLHQLVIVAHLQDEVSSDCPLPARLEVIDHVSTKRDSEASARFLDKTISERVAESKRTEDNGKAWFEPLTALGFSAYEFYSTGIHFKDAAGTKFQMHSHFQLRPPYEVSLNVSDVQRGSRDVKAALDQAIAGTGCEFENELREAIVVKGLTNATEVPEATARLKELAVALEAARNDVYWQAFVKETKLTAGRKRFLKAAAEFGIHEYWNRGNNRACAGGVDIGQTEINTLLHRRWIAKLDGNLVVTEDGKAAVGIVAEN